METKGWDRRGIEKPDNERVIVGPHESFNETLKNNTSLLRRLIRNQDLVTELIHLGKQNRTDAALLYLEGLTDPQLLERVRDGWSPFPLTTSEAPVFWSSLLRIIPGCLFPSSWSRKGRTGRLPI